MDKDLKIALAIIGGALLVCALPTVAVFLFAPWVLQGEFTIRAPDANRMGNEIIEYVLPPGYRERNETNNDFYQTVFIEPEAGPAAGMSIMLLQYSSLSGMGGDPLGD